MSHFLHKTGGEGEGRGARRRLFLPAILAALALMLSACGRIMPPEPEHITVYATFYPLYALADGVLHDVPDATLKCLAEPQDGCLRSYALSDWDAARLENDADAVILGGRGLESFDGALMNWGSGAAVTAVLYNLPLYNAGDGAAHNTASESESHLDGPNPHLYMSIDGAKAIVESIGASMQSLDPVYAERYLQNTEAALQQLDALREETREIAGDLAGRRVVLMNEALIYVAQDYGLEVADWIDRESGVSYYDDELAACLERLSGSEAAVILIERQAPQGFVAALEAAGFRAARLDVLSTHREGEGFQTYLNAQLANARALRDAFQ